MKHFLTRKLTIGLVLTFAILAVSAYAVIVDGVNYTGFTNLFVSGRLATGPLAELSMTQANVEITGSSQTIDVRGKALIVLDATANTTGTTLTNGRKGQVVMLRAANGFGTNTMLFNDNGASMSLGADRTLTEGNNSTLGLICTSSGGTSWAQLFFNAN